MAPITGCLRLVDWALQRSYPKPRKDCGPLPFLFCLFWRVTRIAAWVAHMPEKPEPTTVAGEFTDRAFCSSLSPRNPPVVQNLILIV